CTDGARRGRVVGGSPQVSRPIVRPVAGYLETSQPGSDHSGVGPTGLELPRRIFRLAQFPLRLTSDRCRGYPMRLGGFVIHGDDVTTLSRCLKSLQSVCDQVVAVDSFSTDGSLDLVKSLGVPFIQLRWQGYGAARAAAAKALALCDYLFYLDSDEYLLEEAVDRSRSWALSGPQSSVYLVKRRNHVDLDGHRFVFHTDTRARLIRRDAANWTASMIVHESLPRRDQQRTKIIVEHLFASSIADRLAKDE